jgi:hypothetical protein
MSGGGGCCNQNAGNSSLAEKLQHFKRDSAPCIELVIG